MWVEFVVDSRLLRGFFAGFSRFLPKSSKNKISNSNRKDDPHENKTDVVSFLNTVNCCNLLIFIDS